MYHCGRRKRVSRFMNIYSEFFIFPSFPWTSNSIWTSDKNWESEQHCEMCWERGFIVERNGCLTLLLCCSTIPYSNYFFLAAAMLFRSGERNTGQHSPSRHSWCFSDIHSLHFHHFRHAKSGVRGPVTHTESKQKCLCTHRLFALSHPVFFLLPLFVP